MKITACLVAAGCALVLLAWRTFQRVDRERSKDSPARDGSHERLARGRRERSVEHHPDHPCGECMLTGFLEPR